MRTHSVSKAKQGKSGRSLAVAVPMTGDYVAFPKIELPSLRVIWARMDIRTWPRSRRYGATILGTFVLLWLPVLLFLQFSAPTYTCKWTLILPGTGLGSTIHLEAIGDATASSSSPYQSSSLDPKVTYKAIAESEPVLEEAAKAISLEVERFGKPKVKLVDQTSLLYFSVKGDSAEQAYLKALALTTSLQAHLQLLRTDEAKRHSEAVHVLLQGFQHKLDETQHNILAYQNDSKLNSLEQVKELTISVEQLRKEFALLHAQYQQAEQRTAQLTMSLRVSPRLAADTLLLQADPLFQQFLRDYTGAEGRFADYNGKWGQQHPEVLKVQEQVQHARGALLRRGESLLGHSLREQDERIQLLVSQDMDKRGQLLQNLITADAERQGIAAQVATLQQTLQELEVRLQQSSGAATTLADLNRQHQAATVVFTSALAQLDLAKSNPFTSYPLVQVLAAPARPKQPDTLKNLLAVLGATCGSVFTLLAFALVWHRQALRQKILKSA